MPRPITYVVAVVAFAAVVRGQDEFHSDRHGFRIGRPGAAWSFTPESGSGDTFKLHLQRAAERGPVGARVEVTPHTGDGNADEVRRDALARIGSRAEYAGAESVRERIAGRESPGIEVDYTDPRLGRFHRRSHWLGADGVRCALRRRCVPRHADQRLGVRHGDGADRAVGAA